MGQGLLGVLRGIGSSLGITVSSVLFARRRAWHQLQAYATYNEMSPAHAETLDDLKQQVQQAGVTGGAIEQAVLRTVKRQMDVEAVAAGFRDSFMLVCIFFVFASLPMLWLFIRRRQS
jgi:hypothetical protein